MADTEVLETPRQTGDVVRECTKPGGPESVGQSDGQFLGPNLPGILRRAKRDIGSLAPNEIRILHRTVGNQAVARLIAGATQNRLRQPIQAKLTIGAPDDVYEKEADAVADQVISRSSALQRQAASPELRRKCACGSQSEEECPNCRAKRLALQRHATGDVAGAEAPSIVADVLATPGQPLADVARKTLEPGFGHDFSHVRVHDDSKAAESASAVHALAYTVGNHVVFGQGQYAPGTSTGDRLLAHELTHTIQQTGGRPAASQSGNDIVDRTPDSAAAAFISVLQRAWSDADPASYPRPKDTSLPPTPLGSGVVQRDPSDSTSAPVGGSTPDYSKMTWLQLLPHAYGAKGGPIAKIDLHTPGNRIDARGTGQAPSLNYVPDKDIRTDPATATPQGGVGGTPEADALAAAQSADLSAAQDAAVSQIIAARAKIPDRPMGRSPNNNAGYDYNPDKDPAAKDYNDWTKSALPTGVQANDWNWQVFKQIQGLEGQEGRFTTFDKTLSVGPGYSTSGGQTQQVIGKTLALLPEVSAVAFSAGLSVDAAGGMNVVDTGKKWILASQDAAAYLQTETSLLSLLVNVSQGVQPVDSGGAVAPDEQAKQRQALLDTEWKQFLGGTLAGVTSLVQSWPLDSAVLAVHAKHAQPGNFPFSFWNGGNGPDLATMVAAIYDKVGVSAKYICSGKYAQYQGKSTTPTSTSSTSSNG